MTNASIKNLLFGFSVLMLAGALSLGSFATIAHANGDSGDLGGDGWSSFGSGYSDDSWSSFGSGYTDDTWSSYGSGYESDWSSFGTGYSDEDWSSFGSGYTDDSWSSFGDAYNPGTYETYSYSPGFYDTDSYSPGYYNTDSYSPGYYDTDSYSPGYYYTDSYSVAPTYHATPMSITPPSYTPPRTTSYPSYPSYPTYPTPQPPRYTPPSTTSSVSNTNTNINTNTCTNNSCNTNINNIDNSINGSFNTATVVAATPQPIIQYQIPPVQNQGLYCLISASVSTVQSGQTTYLAWSSSYGVTSATLSEAGNVPTTGTYAVRPLTTRMYTLTVYGQNGQTASCNVMVTVNNAAPYVSLSQIPYTGIDFDIMGSAVYWATLLSIAIAGAYLVVYYQGGVLALATSRKTDYSTPEPVILSETITSPEETVTEVVEEVEAPVAPAVDAFAHLPVMTDRSTKDSMSIAHRADGMPRIVISRA